MKLTDFLQDVGRPVAYYPGLRRVTGSTTATMLLCQLVYWIGKESDPDGWIYKRAEHNDEGEQSIEDETGLSYHEQLTARRVLKRLGLLEEKSNRIEHRLYFRVNLDKLNEIWGHLPKRVSGTNEKGGTFQSASPELPKRVSGTSKARFDNRNTETTTQSTTKNTLGSSEKNTPPSRAGEDFSPDSTLPKEQNQESRVEEKIRLSREKLAEDLIQDIAVNFARYAGLKDIPSKSDSRYPKWRKAYKALAGICDRTGVPPQVLALACDMKREEMSFEAGWPGAYINTAENMAAALTGSEHDALMRQVSWHYQEREAAE